MFSLSINLNTMMRKVIGVALILLSNYSVAQKAEVFSTAEGAIGGYDPVAYFILNKPEKGSEQFSLNHKGADWYFANAENLKLFKDAPEKYVPQFGGYCSYAVSQNYTYAGDPFAFTIVAGKLYLNASPGVVKKWLEKKDEYIQSANKNWPDVLKK
jgi:YHS domain-containing protein